MTTNKMIFAQLIELASHKEFQKSVARYEGERGTRRFSCWDQFLCMAFAQLTYRESLRDIEACLRTKQKKLFHLGIRGKISRSTLADANDRRDWRIFHDFAQVLISQAQNLYAKEKLSSALSNATYALDSTTIDLCLKLFPWAKFRSTKAGVKLHTLINVKTNIPTVIVISCADLHDVNILDELHFEAGAIYIMDRGYLDFARLFNIGQAMAFFVTRSKKNTLFKRLYSHAVDRTTGVIADQTITLTGANAPANYPHHLRRVVYRDIETNKRLVFLTNNFALPAKTIADLYKSRWRIELFFKWIKQHLRIKAFFGTSRNAVFSQIWIAVSVFVLIAIAKKRLALSHTPYTILQILSVSLFDKTHILTLFADVDDTEIVTTDTRQLNLFDF